nr:MAG TPA: hypothetical protein [Caudoviricetes sp.]
MKKQELNWKELLLSSLPSQPFYSLLCSIGGKKRKRLTGKLGS